MFQSEAAIDDACDQDRVLREHFLPAARCRPEKVLPPELDEIFEPREMGIDEPEDDETETERALSERKAGALPTTPQPGASTAHRVGTALRHAGARREAIRFVLKELRCPTCEAGPLTLKVYWYDLVDLEVRNGISARALHVVCWGTGLQVVQELWNGCTAHAVNTVGQRSLSTIKDRSPWGVTSETLREPQVSSQCPSIRIVPGRMVKPKEPANLSNTSCGTWTKNATLKARWSLKRQSPGVVTRETATVIGRFFSAHQRVFGSSLRLPLSADPINRLLLTSDPYTDVQRSNDMRSAAQRALFKQNSARAVQAAGLARHRSQPREDVNAGDTAIVWRNNRTRCCRCRVANENITLDIHAWVSAEEFDRTRSQGDRRRMARRRVE